jgi:hypothetical protein
MDRKVFFAFVLGVLVVGAPLALQIYMLSEQLSGLESQLNDLRNQMTALIECVPMQVEATAGPIRLTLSLNKTSYWLGESVNITLRITNGGNETALLARSSPPLLDFVVYDVSSQIFSGPQVVTPVCVEKSLNPEESFSMNLVWNQHAHSNYTQVEPGIYFIMGETAPFTTITVGGQEIEEIETPKIPIELRALNG